MPHRPQGEDEKTETEDSNNNAVVGRVVTGGVKQHRKGDDVFDPLMDSGALGFQSTKMHSLSLPPLCHVFPEGHTSVSFPSRQSVF